MAEPTTAFPWASRALTPMLRQYAEAKTSQPDALLLFRMGDFYELFFDDAKVAAEALDLTLTARDKGPNPVPMAGVPHHALDGYLARLVALGHSVAICDQLEDPKEAKGIVRRGITRLVTPATVCDLAALDPGQSPWLAALVALPPPHANANANASAKPAAEAAVALLDLLTGELRLTTVGQGELFDEVVALGARELLADEPLLPLMRQAAAARRQRLPVRALRPGGAATAADAAPRPVDRGALLAAPAHARAALNQAIDAVLAYGAHTQRAAVPHVAAARWFHRRERLAMDEATRDNLELFVTARERDPRGALLAHLDRTHTPMGARLLRHWLMFPLRRLAAIARRADAVAALAADRAGRQRLGEALRGVRDIARLAGRVALDRATPRDVQALAAGLVALGEVRVAVLAVSGAQEAELLHRWRQVPFPRALADRLLRSLNEALPASADAGGLFRRGIDDELDGCLELTENADAWLSAYENDERARCRLPGLKVRFNRVFGYFIELSRLQARQAPAHFVRKQTTANAERFATAALDDFAVRAHEAGERRRACEQRLFQEALGSLKAVLPEVQAAAEEVARLDVLQSLADVADRHRYVRPELHERRTLTLKRSRHPVVETLMPLGERFVANDIALDASDERLWVLTGPNMAGKSTIMRQAAQIVVLAQMGAFVPCDHADIGVCDQLFVRVGASDNLGRGQSTFLVEMTETASILRQATEQSFVLLDEIGRGTATFDGLSIAWAVAEYLDDALGCRAMFATHYHELCRLAEVRPRVANVHVTVHERDGHIAFLRQLAPGAAGRSYGIEVARLAAVPPPVLARAGEILAALEGTGPATPGDVAASACRALQDRQLALFGDPPPAAPRRRPPKRAPAPRAEAHAAEGRAAAHNWQRALGALDLGRTTPLEALSLLHDWQQRLGRDQTG